MRKNFFVDDGLISVDFMDKVIQLVKEARSVYAKGKLRLRKFISNNRKILESILDTKRAIHDVDLNYEKFPVEMCWE